MNTDAVHIDCGSERQGETRKLFFHMKLFFCNTERDRQSRRAGTGQKRRNDRFLDFIQYTIRIFAAEQQKEHRVNQEDHQQNADHDASGDPHIGSEQFHSVNGEIDCRKRKNADGKILHDPVDDLE